ncbi:MAG: hypothetical protein MRZ79_16075 [Bacteroidia bacterium]|nr:hypothetical protein [Bacteroidia bacterium]
MGNSKRKYLSLIAIIISISLLSGIYTWKCEEGSTSNEAEASSILQFRATTKNIVPSFFFLSMQQDTSNKAPSSPAVDPLPEKESIPHHEPEQEPETSSPTWVQMMSAIVNVFLSLYQSH